MNEKEFSKIDRQNMLKIKRPIIDIKKKLIP